MSIVYIELGKFLFRLKIVVQVTKIMSRDHNYYNQNKKKSEQLMFLAKTLQITIINTGKIFSLPVTIIYERFISITHNNCRREKHSFKKNSSIVISKGNLFCFFFFANFRQIYVRK